ncbi:hypothetical protein D3C80_1329000 [compost metagenome]
MGRGVELGRSRLQLGQGAGGDVGQAEGRGRQEALGRDEDLALRFGAVAQAHGAVGRDRDVGRPPKSIFALTCRIILDKSANNIVGQSDDQRVPDDRHVLHGLAF